MFSYLLIIFCKKTKKQKKKQKKTNKQKNKKKTAKNFEMYNIPWN